MSICDLNNKKAKINYPTFWKYKAIFNADENADEIIEEILKDKKYEIKFSKFSKDKKYKSYDLGVFVKSEKERLDIFSKVKKVAKYVL